MNSGQKADRRGAESRAMQERHREGEGIACGRPLTAGVLWREGYTGGAERENAAINCAWTDAASRPSNFCACAR
jgi:hypothetical protein